MDWFDREHPAFAIFADKRALPGIKFYKFRVLRAPAGIIALAGQYPLIIVRDNVCVIATTFRPENTDLVYKAVFVPLLHRLISSLVNRRPDREYRVGATVDGSKPLRGISGELITGHYFAAPGFYIYGRDTIAVNVAPAEGDLKVVSPAVLKVYNIGTIDGPGRDRSGIDLIKGLLIIALAAAGFEVLLLLRR